MYETFEKTRLMNYHTKERMEWAKNVMPLNKKRKQDIFSDEKNTLGDPDRYKHLWRDLRKAERMHQSTNGRRFHNDLVSF